MWKSDILYDLSESIQKIKQGYGVGFSSTSPKKLPAESILPRFLSIHAAVERATVFHLDGKEEFYRSKLNPKIYSGGIYAPSLKFPYSDTLIELSDSPDTGSCAAILVSNEEGGEVLVRALMRPKELPRWSLIAAEMSLSEKDSIAKVIRSVPVKEKINLEIYLVGYATEAKLTIDFLQCTNIASPRIVPSEKLNRSRAKKGKLPLYEYRVLEVIQDLSGKGKAEAEKTALPWGYQTPDERKLSKSSGEFKTYTEEAPLLGKYVGTYWL